MILFKNKLVIDRKSRNGNYLCSSIRKWKILCW